MHIQNNNAPPGSPEVDDRLVILLAEDQELNKETLFFITNSSRTSEIHEQTILPRYQGAEMHVWIAFINQEQTTSSNSVYLGTVTVT